MFLRCFGRCCIEFAVALLDPSRADMALYRHPDMVRAIAGTCCVEFLSGFAGGQGKNTLAQAQASCTGPRPADLPVAALGGRPRPRVPLEAFTSAAEASLGLLAGGVLLNRVSTRSAVSRSIN